MGDRSIHDSQAMFDVSLQAAQRRISGLRADGGRDFIRAAAPAHRSPGVRYALGVRLLAIGAALVADDPIIRSRRPLARG